MKKYQYLITLNLIKQLTGLLLMMFLIMPSKIYAQYPDGKIITLVIPFAEGGTTDKLAKHLITDLEQILNTTIEIVNMRGEGGSIGLSYIKNSEANGLWIGIASTSSLISNATLNNNLNYHPIDDFTHIANIAIIPHVLVANKNLNITNFSEFTQLVKNNNKYIYASSGTGSTGHLLFAKLNSLIGGNLEHKAYTGSAGALKSLSIKDSNTSFMFDQVISAKSYINDDKVKLIAVSSNNRLDFFPNTPTFSELGFEELNRMSTYMIVAPKNLPKEIIIKLREAINLALNKPDTLDYFKNNGLLPGSEQPGKSIKEDYDFYRNIVNNLNLRLEN